jgi:phytoene dehydrogenase-like protein
MRRSSLFCFIGWAVRPLKTSAFLTQKPYAFATTHRQSLSLPNQSIQSSSLYSSSIASGCDEIVDVIVVGSGVGGLSCAALCQTYGYDTLCLEAHDTPGGCAHSFKVFSQTVSKTTPFQFDSGPSLISGLSSKGSNPLRQVLDAIGTADKIEWKRYDGWMVWDYSDGKCFRMTTGSSGEFEKAIERKAGKVARLEFERFREEMLRPGGLSEASAYIPPFALRGVLDFQVLLTMRNYIFKFLSIGFKGALLTGPFSRCLDLAKVKDPFIRKWFDYLAFALSGLDAAHTQAAPVLYTMLDLHKDNAVLDYPIGGMGALINALVEGLVSHGGNLRLNSRVERFLIEEVDAVPKCTGVILSNGVTIRARRGVVTNASLWNTARILQDSLDELDHSAIRDAVEKVSNDAKNMQMTGSFMHLHLGIPNDGLNALDCHHSVMNFDHDVTDPQNLVIISIPTVFDPSLAPQGYHIVHAYTAASENFDDWLSFLEDKTDTGKVGSAPSSSTARSYSRNEEYKLLKKQKEDALWKAVEQIIPDVRERASRVGSVVLVGTPLTHRRYNQRFRGTYGPAPKQGGNVWELQGTTTPISGLLACGDTCFPGIGLPAVAASGTIAANTLADVEKQLQMLESLRNTGALQ